MLTKKKTVPCQVVSFWPVRAFGPNEPEYSAFHKTVTKPDGGKYVLVLEPGQPTLLLDAEVEALQDEVGTRVLPSITISEQHARLLMSQIVDEKRDSEITRLRGAVVRLKAALAESGFHSQAEIDAIVAADKLAVA